jgi:hypothetical protein
MIDFRRSQFASQIETSYDILDGVCSLLLVLRASLWSEPVRKDGDQEARKSLEPREDGESWGADVPRMLQ